MLANTHLTGDGPAPNNFLTPEIRKLAKNLVYFGLYLQDLLGGGNCTKLGNFTKLSYLMCPYRGIKRPHVILGVLLLKKFWAEKRRFPQRHFATLLQISPDWNKTP